MWSHSVNDAVVAAGAYSTQISAQGQTVLMLVLSVQRVRGARTILTCLNGLMWLSEASEFCFLLLKRVLPVRPCSTFLLVCHKVQSDDEPE